MANTNRVTIRPWQPGDDQEIWSVLSDGSFSNINATFMLLLRKPFVKLVIVILPTIEFACGLDLLFIILSSLFLLAILYFVSFIGAVVYLYGSLSDMKDIKASYFLNPDHHFWVAEYEGKIVGTIAIVKKMSPLKGSPLEQLTSDNELEYNKVAWLRRMVVNRRYRGLGIAKQLVRESLKFCRSRRYNKVFLITTEVHHAARSLYSNLGFQLIACKPYTYGKGLITVETFEFEMML